MSQTDVDFTISAHLPSICDSELHANMGPLVNALTSGADIADSCDVYVSDDEGEIGGAGPASASGSAAPSAVVNRGASRGAVAAPPLKRRAVADFGIALKQSNPKRAGSNAHARYEVYKVFRLRCCCPARAVPAAGARPPRRAALALLPLVPRTRTRLRASTRARAHGRPTTNDATCGPPAWLTGRLQHGGIRSVRSPPRCPPLLATPIATPLQGGRPERPGLLFNFSRRDASAVPRSRRLCSRLRPRLPLKGYVKLRSS